MLVPATGSSCCEAPGFFSTSLSWVMMNRELQVQIHDKIFHEIMLAIVEVIGLNYSIVFTKIDWRLRCEWRRWWLWGWECPLPPPGWGTSEAAKLLFIVVCVDRSPPPPALCVQQTCIVLTCTCFAIYSSCILRKGHWIAQEGRSPQNGTVISGGCQIKVTSFLWLFWSFWDD